MSEVGNEMALFLPDDDVENQHSLKHNANAENAEIKADTNANVENAENTPIGNHHDQRDFVLELTTFLIFPLRLKHRLSHIKLSALGSLTLTFPLIAIALGSGILSFLSSSVGNSEQLLTNSTNVVAVNGLNYTLDSLGDGKQDPGFISERTREIFIIIIGVLSLVQIAIQKLGQHYNFSARSEMHHTVAKNLNELFDKIIFKEKSLAGEKEKRSLSPEELDKFQELFEMCSKSCSSPIPIQIEQAFRMVEHRCFAFISKKDYERKKKKKVDQDDMIKPLDMYRGWMEFSFEELSADISSHRLWWMIPRCPKKAVERVMTRMEEEWSYIFEDSPRNSHSRRGLLC